MTGEPKWLLRVSVEAMHDMLLAEYGGSAGTRDSGLLKSALARPRNLLIHGEEDLHAIAAAYAFGIERNHPFVDGNKRTAFLAAYVFLNINGLTLSASEPDVVRVMLPLTDGAMNEAAFADWLKQWIELK